MMAKIKIKKNDTVIVTTGNSKGVKGKVIKVYPSENRAMVEGANMISKHTKPNAANPQGGIEEAEAGIHISNVMLVVNGVASRVGRKTDENGKLVRFLKKNGEVVK